MKEECRWIWSFLSLASGWMVAPRSVKIVYVAHIFLLDSSDLEQSFSISAPLTFWTGCFFVVSAVLCIVGCLTASLASTC